MKITDSMIKKSCSATIYKRGMEYFKEGRVHLKKRENNLISAVVDGEELYNVQIHLSENGVEDCFCTCPYFETMNSVCKHIVSTLKQRQKELDEGENYIDENDKIAKMLCGEFASANQEKTPLPARFTLHITKHSAAKTSYAASMEVNGIKVHGIENFLDSYLTDKEFKFDRYTIYNPGKVFFPKYQNEIIKILAETYENRIADTPLYIKAAYQTSFGSLALKRILPILSNVDFNIIFDGMNLGSLQIKNDNPDILIDVNAEGGQIDMSVSDRGFALTYDGEWFLYENTIYHTSSEWQAYFMPIYHALATESRTQISFKGDNTISFATHVLPVLKYKQGVITNGIEDMIVDAIPSFEVYFDSFMGSITAVIKANYGNIGLRLPGDDSGSKKIVVRDFELENRLLSHFNNFTHKDNMFTLSSDDDIYNFLSEEIPIISKIASLHYSERFTSLKIVNSIDINASVKYNKKIDLLEADFESKLSYEEISGILNAVKLKKQFYRLPDGSFIDIADNEQGNIFNLLEQLDFSDDDLKIGKKTISKYHALYLNSLVSVKKSEEFIEYMQEIKSTTVVLPAELDAIVRPYQCDGITWLAQLSKLGFGGILADDMGLGKTLQVIAYIHSIQPDKPTLIIAPSALTYNWLSEINKFTPKATAIIIDGTKEERATLLKNIEEYEFVITSYPLLRRDISLYKEFTFAYCFIDEAQHIKNQKTMNARSVKKINAEHRFALTGTPIENSLIELWSIFDFIMPGYLYSSHEFRNKYENPLIHDGNRSVADNFRMRIKPFMLRRMKSDVLNELPEKIENTMYAELTAEQKELYSSYLAIAKDTTLSILSEGGSGKMRILTLLMRLRQICCHPTLFDENYAKESGKLNLLTELVTNAVEAGHRILIFSQFTSMLSIIKDKLKSIDIDCFYLDGKTPSYERAELADRFNGGENSVFLISLKAGGVGLNLTGADMVIHYDPWWNPAVTEQASDRAYRIGQTKAVQVIRLAAKGTIEEKILKLQENKKNLAEDIVRVNTDTFKNLTNEEILSLFS